MATGVEALVPHGGFIILPVVNGKLWYALSIIVGAAISAGILHFTKPSLVDEKRKKKEENTEQVEVAK